MKSIFRCAALFMCGVLSALSLFSCGRETVPSFEEESQTEVTSTGIILFRNRSGDTSRGEEAALGAKEYALENDMRFISVLPEEEEEETLLDSIDEEISQGYSTAVFVGAEYSDTVTVLSGVMPSVNFILIDAYAAETDNVTSVFLDDFDCGYTAGYIAAASGHNDIGFFAELETEWSIDCLDGFVSGVCAASELTEEEYTVSFSFGDALFESETNDAKAKLLYDNGCEHVFACGAVADKSVSKASLNAGGSYSSRVDSSNTESFEFAVLEDYAEGIKYVLEKVACGEMTSGTEQVGLAEECVKVASAFPDFDAKECLKSIFEENDIRRIEKDGTLYFTPSNVSVIKCE